MPPKGLAMLIVGKGKPPEGSAAEEAAEPPDEAASEGDEAQDAGTDYQGVAGDVLAAVKAGDQDALATALQALCGMAASKAG